MGPNDSWEKLNRGDLTILAQRDVEILFGAFEIIEIFEFDQPGHTLAGRQKHWHTYSVVARKLTR